jgi:iron(III) transport system permease protein
MTRRPPWAYLVWGFLLLFALAPMAAMLMESFRIDGDWSAEAWRRALESSNALRLLGRSLGLSLAVAAATLVAGTGLGVLLQKCRIPHRRPIFWLYLLPLLVPPYVWAVGWGGLLAPGGPVATLLGDGAAEALASRFYGFWGVFFTLFWVYLPIPALLAAVALRQVGASLEEAARLLLPWSGVLRHITLPLVAPSLWLGFVLVFSLTMGEMTVPGYLRYDVFVMESFLHFSAFYDFSAATAAAVPLLLAAWLLVAGNRWVGGEKWAVTAEGRSVVWSLARPRLAAFLAALPALAAVGLPLASLAVEAASAPDAAATLRDALPAAGRTLLYAALGATLLTLLGFFTGYGIARKALPGYRFADTLTLLLFALPPTVLAIGMVALFNTPWGGWLYGTPTLLVLAYGARYLLLPSRIVASHLSALPPSLEEAAQLAGAEWGAVARHILLPLLKRALAASWLAAFIFCMRDVALTMMLYPPGNETLGVRLFTLMANGDPRTTALLCLLGMAMVLPTAVALHRSFR